MAFACVGDNCKHVSNNASLKLFNEAVVVGGAGRLQARALLVLCVWLIHGFILLNMYDCCSCTFPLCCVEPQMTLPWRQ